MKGLIIIICTVLLLPAGASPLWAEAATEGTISIRVTGLKNDKGQVCIALYNSPDTFPVDEKHFRATCAGIVGKTATIALPNIPPGQYAAFAFHDKDGDGKLKTNWLGIPKEGVGASRGAKGRMGPPKFKDAAFDVGKGGKQIQIAIQYL